ncbi:hypothetical protein GJ496_007901 [Pomphorhynchus laevis]|nr:hypothetical protein GJ496_007898 [Pomphorhynchus laevis]KAI0979688.1 hypothetical protein GJ496_007901 [Pomphorhynchus laevis]
MPTTSDIYNLFHVTSVCFQHISDELKKFNNLNSHQGPEVVTEDSKWTTAERKLLQDAVSKFANSVEKIDKKLEAKISVVNESSNISSPPFCLSITTARDLEIINETLRLKDYHVARDVDLKIETKSKSSQL